MVAVVDRIGSIFASLRLLVAKVLNLTAAPPPPLTSSLSPSRRHNNTNAVNSIAVNSIGIVMLSTALVLLCLLMSMVAEKPFQSSS